MITVGIFVVCTNKYTEFFPKLHASFAEHFASDARDAVGYRFIVFTDQPEKFTEYSNVTAFYHMHKPWPASTLYRFHMFNRVADTVSDCDVLAYIDVDAFLVNEFSSQIVKRVLAQTEQDVGILPVLHCGFWQRHPSTYTYERNPKSTAYIPEGQGKMYVGGGFFIGQREKFLAMSKVLAQNITYDDFIGVRAIHNDESHLNRYFFDHQPSTVLSPAFHFSPLPYFNLAGRGVHPVIMLVEKDHKQYQV